MISNFPREKRKGRGGLLNDDDAGGVVVSGFAANRHFRLAVGKHTDVAIYLPT